MRVDIKCASDWLCVCLSCLCGVGCATASWHSCFKPADQSYLVQFPLLCVTSWQDDFLFQSFQIAMPKQKLKANSHDKSHQNITHQTFREEYTETFLCIVGSVQSTQHVKCNACFLGLFCFHGGIYDVSKGKAIGSTRKI